MQKLDILKKSLFRLEDSVTPVFTADLALNLIY